MPAKILENNLGDKFAEFRCWGRQIWAISHPRETNLVEILTRGDNFCHSRAVLFSQENYQKITSPICRPRGSHQNNMGGTVALQRWPVGLNSEALGRILGQALDKLSCSNVMAAFLENSVAGG